MTVSIIQVRMLDKHGAKAVLEEVCVPREHACERRAR